MAPWELNTGSSWAEKKLTPTFLPPSHWPPSPLCPHPPLPSNNLPLLEDPPCTPSGSLVLVHHADREGAHSPPPSPLSPRLSSSLILWGQSWGHSPRSGRSLGPALGWEPVPDRVLGARVGAWDHRGQGLGEGGPPREGAVILVTSNGELRMDRTRLGSLPRLSSNPPLGPASIARCQASLPSCPHPRLEQPAPL